MKIYNIRTKDVVKFRVGLTSADKQRITKFARRISKQDDMRHYANDFINARYRFVVHKCSQTQKVPTEYALIRTTDEVYIPVQTRYLELVMRKPQHPLTKIFQD